MKIRILLFFIIIFVFNIANGQSFSQSVPVQAEKDEIWLKTYQTLGIQLRTQLRATQKTGIIAMLSDQFKIDEKIIRAFLRFALSYAPKITVEKVLVRYPHYNPVPLKKDISASLKQGLVKFNQKSNAYQVTRKGKSIIKQYWALKSNQASLLRIELNQELDIVYKVLKKITREAARINDGFINSSIQWSRKNKYKAPKKTRLLVKVFNPFNDLVAFVNDNAHYRFDRLSATDIQWNSIQLGPLAKELLGAMRNGRTYALHRCYEQPNWRQPKENCEAAIEELMQHNLVLQTDNHFTQNENGQKYFKAAEHLTTKRLYSFWEKLDIETYLNYKKALEQINNKIEQQQ